MIITVDMGFRVPQALGGVTRVVPQLYQAPLRRPVFGNDVLAFTGVFSRE
jgi:hypothetical protein